MNMRSPVVLILAAGLCVGACSDSTEPGTHLPLEIRQCETYLETFCSVWTRVDNEEYDYLAEWDQGTVGEITVLLFAIDSVAFYRNDIAGPSLGVTGEYHGMRAGSYASGLVTFYDGRQHGWEAEW
jgi:hypothetical protein